MLISKHVNMYIAICVNLICTSGLVFNFCWMFFFLRLVPNYKYANKLQRILVYLYILRIIYPLL